MRKLLFILLLLLTLAACTTSTPNPNPNPNPNPQPRPDEDTRTPNPHNVSIELDTARKTTGEITPAGGTLSATAADGTTFTLVFPENAVLSKLQVSMTPISNINDLPLTGGYIGAVHLEPEGMEFLEPVTLTIQAAQPFDASKLKGFNSHEMGEEFYLQLMTVSGQTITMQLTHFSNPGAAVANDLDDLVIDLVPTDPRDRFEHDLGLDLREDVKKAEQITKNFYGRVKGKLETARSETSTLKSAIRDFLTWRKAVSQLGFDEVFKKEIFQGWTLVAEGIENAVDKAYTACAVNDDFTHVVDILGWISWVKNNPRLAPYFEGKLAAFEQKASNCATFDLTFEYVLEQETYAFGFDDHIISNVRSNHRVQSTIEVSYSHEYGMLTGSAPLESVVFTASGYSGDFGANLPPDCPTVEPHSAESFLDFSVGGDQNEKSTIPVTSLLIDVDNPDAPLQEVQTLTLVMHPGLLTELFTMNCNFGTQIVGGVDGHAGSYALFPYLHDVDYEALEWWRVPFTFSGGQAEYEKIHDYSGPHYMNPDDEETRLELTGSTKLVMKHTPK
jgi:hypothetical protein